MTNDRKAGSTNDDSKTLEEERDRQDELLAVAFLLGGFKGMAEAYRLDRLSAKQDTDALKESVKESKTT